MNKQHEAKIITWLKEDALRMSALKQAAKLKLPDWCLAAGFVRNLAWDKQHGYESASPLNDIDLIYFNAGDVSEATDRAFERELLNNSDLPWSVKNQARMHIRNNDQPYLSTSDAMSYWCEVETAVGARLNVHGDVECVAPFGLERLFTDTITLNIKRPKIEDFTKRVNGKNWLTLWPKLKVV